MYRSPNPFWLTAKVVCAEFLKNVQGKEFDKILLFGIGSSYNAGADGQTASGVGPAAGCAGGISRHVRANVP